MSVKNLFHRAIGLWRKEGAAGLLKGVVRFLYWNVGVRAANHRIQYSLSSEEISVTVGSTERSFPIGSYVEFVRYYTLMNEKKIIEDLLSELDRSDTFADIGANVGIYTVFADSYLDSEQIEAFEPHPANLEALYRNISHNGVKAHVHECALSDQQGEFILEPSGEDSGEGEHSLATDRSTTGIEVDVERLDDLVINGSATQPTVVKIDVEGAEFDVIQGAEETLSKDACRLIYCEIHPDRMETYGGSYKHLRAKLGDMGFEVVNVFGTEGEYSTLKAKKAT